MKRRCGTPGFTAPEVLVGSGYSFKCDLFSIGCIFFSWLTGRELFKGSNSRDVYNANKQCKFDYINHYLRNTSVNASNLLLSLLESDPRKRPTAR
jgi:serine/threonine protein kinase